MILSYATKLVFMDEKPGFFASLFQRLAGTHNKDLPTSVTPAPSDPLPPLNEEELALVAQDRKASAIKAYRDRVGADLLAAKEAVDDAAASRQRPESPVSLAPVGPDGALPPLNEAELSLVTQGNLIAAVAEYKKRTGCGLKEAKAAIDAVRA